MRDYMFALEAGGNTPDSLSQRTRVSKNTNPDATKVILVGLIESSQQLQSNSSSHYSF